MTAKTLALTLLSLLSFAVLAQEQTRVKVSQEVINAGLGGFAATVGQIGNSASRGVGSAFEPVQWRDKLMVTEGHASAVVATKADISASDTIAQGFLDDASIMVFRIINGKMQLIRRDKVRVSGHKASGWQPLTASTKLLAPSVTQFEVNFDDSHRSGVDYWFAVQAVGYDGSESLPSNPVRVKHEKVGNNSATETPLVDFAPSRWALFAAPPASPRGLQVHRDVETGAAVLHWAPGDAQKIAGYRVLRSDYAPKQHQGFRLELEARGPAAAPLKVGDMVFVHKTLNHPSRKMMLTNRAHNSTHKHDLLFDNPPSFFPDEDPSIAWSLEPHAVDTPVTSPGRTALRLDMSTEAIHRYERYAFGDAGQPSHWWPVLDPAKEYVVEAWMRQQDMGSAKVQFTVEGRYQGQIPAIEFDVGETWQQHQATFRVPHLLDQEGPVGMMALSFTGPGTLWLDNYRIYEKGTPYLALLPTDEQALLESEMTALRSHQFIKTRRRTYTMDEFTNPAGVINATRGNTLPQFLQILEKLNMQPWLQVEFFMSPEEWLGFAEYMAAPYDPAVDTPEHKPWAAKRYQQGRKEPWVDAFDRIYFELSNETWNGLFAPWTFAPMPDAATGQQLDRGTVYGLFQEWVIEQLKASPYWSAELDEKFEFVIGGWAVQPGEDGYGARAIAASPQSAHMTIADYIGGWDEGEGPAAASRDSFQRILMHAAQLGTLRSASHATTHRRHSADGIHYRLGVYEAGPGYAMSRLNNQPPMSRLQVEEQARAMKSLAAGTATLDSVLTKAQHGFALNNFFTFSRARNYWHSHATWFDGGQAYPAWLGISLFNQHATGDMLRVHVHGAETINIPEHGLKKKQNDLPLTAAYATRQDDRLSVFVISRKVEGSTPVALDLPITYARQVTLYRMTGDARAHNLDSEEVRIEQIPLAQDWTAPALSITPATGGKIEGMPAASVYLYVFEGADFVQAASAESMSIGDHFNDILARLKSALELNSD